MKAVLYEKSSPPDFLTLRELEPPVPQDDEVLIRVRAVSLNAADYRSMRMGLIPKRKIFGSDIAGEVAAAGKAVQKLKIGDRVAGDLSGCGFGGLAEYAAAPEKVLARIPAGVDDCTAAAVPMAAVTALQGLRRQGRLQAGQSVLIYGAGGGVGSFAVQLAKELGAQVTAVCGSRNVELVRALGADRVVDYAREDILQSGERFDLILGVNGSQPLLKYRRVLAARGTLVMVGGGLSQVFSTMIFGPVLSIGGRKIRLLAARPDAADLAWVLDLVAAGKVTPLIDSVYPLQESAAAMRYLKQGHARGKVVIQPV